MGNVIDNSLFVDVEKFNLAVRQYTTQNLISTQRQSVWENLYALFLSKMEENHMEETNVTMTAEEMQGEPAAKENETKAEKFIRIGEYRMNKAVDAIGRLENLANRGSYEYTQEQVDVMFQALERGGLRKLRQGLRLRKRLRVRLSALVQQNRNVTGSKGKAVM